MILSFERGTSGLYSFDEIEDRVVRTGDEAKVSVKIDGISIGFGVRSETRPASWRVYYDGRPLDPVQGAEELDVVAAILNEYLSTLGGTL